MKAYIAFSIHGTNVFITATNEKALFLERMNGNGVVVCNRSDFNVAVSRRPDYRQSDGMKLHWNKLLTKEGTPLRSPPMIVGRFNELERQGWKIDKKAFVEKHWGKKTK